MSDFGAVLEYAMQLEASAPEADLAKLEAIRPAALGPTKKQREELAKAAASKAAASPTPAATPPAPAPATHAATHPAADDKRK
jgi:hypothetical protein